MYEVTEKILREVRKVIVGKDDVISLILVCYSLQATSVYYRGKRKTTVFLLVKAFTSIAKLFIIR